MESADYGRMLAQVASAITQATKDLQSCGSQQRACQIVNGTLAYVVSLLGQGAVNRAVALDLQRCLMTMHKAAEPWTGIRE